METDDQALDLKSAEGRDSSKFWRRSRDAQKAADARLLPRKRGRVEDAEEEKILRGGTGFVFFRSGLRARVRENTRGRGYL